jgi:serine phosphatase RsbU (regulator of sigma subunit)
MDISLCRFDKKNKEIQLALANHTAFILNNGEVIEIEGDEFGIADELIGDDKPEFTDHIFPMDKSATLYMFSDGFPDQFGGAKNKKFYISNLKKLFIENESLPMKEQYNRLSSKFHQWKGSNRQFDDVLVMGFKLDL